ncbi:MAG: putative toxin-antitoxin system toxin component, PIN family [Chloroflexi bacterium]|nr:putative toxin-antitoxin system toxin component, PIN family [Chloroflexota bacterium]
MPVRVVLDTNVLVSGLIAESGPPRALVDAWLDGQYTLISSLYQVQELNHVLSYPRIRERLRLEHAEIDAILATLLCEAELVAGHLAMPSVTRDPKDDPLVACAVEGKADYLVSGDGDLLVLGECHGTRVVTPKAMAEILGI